MTEYDWSIPCGNCGANDENWVSPSGTLCAVCGTCGKCRKCESDDFHLG